ncbi:MAG: hypothetical protein QM730_30535 [Anaerolineales bacterium]
MSKKTLLVSAALTTFVLVVLANVSAVYAQIRNAVAIQPTAVTAETLPVQNQALQVTHQQAATIAANFLGQTDLYSVENAVWNGLNVYKVVFSSGTIVYVSMDGQILGSEAPQPVFVSAPAQNNNNQSQSSGAPSHNEDHEEHEDHDD